MDEPEQKVNRLHAELAQLRVECLVRCCAGQPGTVGRIIQREALAASMHAGQRTLAGAVSQLATTSSDLPRPEGSAVSTSARPPQRNGAAAHVRGSSVSTPKVMVRQPEVDGAEPRRPEAIIHGFNRNGPDRAPVRARPGESWLLVEAAGQQRLVDAGRTVPRLVVVHHSLSRHCCIRETPPPAGEPESPPRTVRRGATSESVRRCAPGQGGPATIRPAIDSVATGRRPPPVSAEHCRGRLQSRLAEGNGREGRDRVVGEAAPGDEDGPEAGGAHGGAALRDDDGADEIDRRRRLEVGGRAQQRSGAPMTAL